MLFRWHFLLFFLNLISQAIFFLSYVLKAVLEASFALLNLFDLSINLFFLPPYHVLCDWLVDQVGLMSHNLTFCSPFQHYVSKLVVNGRWNLFASGKSIVGLSSLPEMHFPCVQTCSSFWVQHLSCMLIHTQTHAHNQQSGWTQLKADDYQWAWLNYCEFKISAGTSNNLHTHQRQIICKVP